MLTLKVHYTEADPRRLA